MNEKYCKNSAVIEAIQLNGRDLKVEMKHQKMVRAYEVYAKWNSEFGSICVFAKDASKAKVIAREQREELGLCSFMDLRAKRFVEADCRYDGVKACLDWNIPEDRKFLESCGWEEIS